jgi:hypothetical protein
MRPASVAATNAIYECASKDRLIRTRISHDAFRAYSLALRRLIRGLGEAASEEAWKTILTPLRRYGFALCAAPLPFNEPSIQPSDVGKLHSLKDALSMVYPAPAMQLGNTIQCMEALLQNSANPYGEWLSEAAPYDRGDRAVLICDSRLVRLAECQLSCNPATRSLSIVTPAQLRTDRCFNVLYVLGAARWFPSSIFEAPRSRTTVLARFSWIKDGREPTKVFLSAALPTTEVDDDPPEHGDTYEAADLLPVVDWRSIGQKIAADELHNTLDSAAARLALLEGEIAVFLEAEDGASVLTIDLDADESTDRIARIPTNDVRAGTFLLLRTSGGGDYIVTEADRYLREQAPKVREAQRNWKALLRQEVQKEGFLAVSLRLIELGSSSADETNVRNYLSPRSIRTRAPEDFKAIMRLVGFGDEWARYWDMMGEIDRAHRRAGKHLRHQLLRRLEELDLTELERVGRMEITLPQVDAGSLTAFRVLDISTDSQLVSINRLGHPFEL